MGSPLCKLLDSTLDSVGNTVTWYEERMTLFFLNDTVCGLACTTGAGKTAPKRSRRMGEIKPLSSLPNSSSFLLSSPTPPNGGYFKTRKQNKDDKRTDRERFASFIERIQTHVAFGWLRKNFMPENFLDDQIMLCFDVILQHDWPIEQCLLRSI